MINLNFTGVIRGPKELVAPASPQTITGAWADLGAELHVAGAGAAGLWANLDINGSTDVRLRLLAKRTSAGADEYVPPIRTVGASVVAVEDEYIEFTNDVDQKMLISWNMDGLIPYIQFQVMAGTLGAPAGIILSAYVTTTLRSSQ